MSEPKIYLSRPTVVLPDSKLDNAEVLRRIRANYKGDENAWPMIEAAVNHVFTKCNSGFRYIEEDPTVRVGDFAARATETCLKENGVAPEDIDLVIYGGIAREYFEPATAMEVAARTGIEQVHAFDVTSACAGQMEAIHIALSYLKMYDHYRTALVSSAELTRNFLCYDIQSPEEMITKAAGLTIGNASSAFLVTKKPLKTGSMEIIGARNWSLPQNWHLCSAPIDGTFTSFSSDLFKLNVHVPPELVRLCESVGWKPQDVDRFVFHQPSESMVEKVLTALDVDQERGVRTHHHYANTSSTTVSLTMNHLFENDKIKDGDKLLLSTAAAGFSMVSIAGIWRQPG